MLQAQERALPDRIPAAWLSGFRSVYPPDAPGCSPPDRAFSEAFARVDEEGRMLQRVAQFCPHGRRYRLR